VEASGAARTLWENSGLLASKRKWEKISQQFFPFASGQTASERGKKENSEPGANDGPGNESR
jgi:hypothetical protein